MIQQHTSDQQLAAEREIDSRRNKQVSRKKSTAGRMTHMHAKVSVDKLTLVSSRALAAAALTKLDFSVLLRLHVAESGEVDSNGDAFRLRFFEDGD